MVSGIAITHLISILVTTFVVLVTDYLHLLGLRSPAIEHGLLRAYPKVANTVFVLLAFVSLTTMLMLASNPGLLSEAAFVVKLTLLAIAAFNGFFLHHKFYPEFFEEIDAQHVRARTIPRTVLSSSVSVSSWTMVLVLSTGIASLATPLAFVVAYLVLIGVCYTIALPLEKRALTRRTSIDRIIT